MASRKPRKRWRTYRAVEGKIVKEVEISNDEFPAVTIYFRDRTQLRIKVGHAVEFQVRLEKLTNDDVVTLHTYPPYKEEKWEF